jgi:multiple sugar transport system substrate-binding protein
MRKFTALLLIAIAALVRPASAQTTDISVSYSLGSYREMLEETKKRFEAAHPNVRVTFRAPVLATHEEHLQQILRGAVTNDTPDVSFQGNQYVGLLARRGLAVPLDAFIAAEKDWAAQGYTPASSAVGRVDGKTFGLAYQTSAPIIFFNTTLLKRAGVSIDPLPSTWEDILEAVKKVQALGSGVTGGMFDYQASGNFTFQSLVNSYGGSMMSPDDRQIAFTGEAGLKALQILRRFGEAGMVDMTQQQSMQAFGAGTVGVMATFSSALEGLQRQAGDRFILQTGPWPMPVAGGTVPAGGRTAILLTRDPVKQRAGWEFIKFATGAEGQTILVKMIGAVPSNRIATERADLLGDFYKNQPNQHAGLKMVPHLAGFYSFPGDDAVKITTVLRDHLRSVVTLQQDPQAALQLMAREVQALLPK